MAMMAVASAAAFGFRVTSHASSPVKPAASAPKPAGKKTHTSLSEAGRPTAASALWTPQAVSCRPGYVVEPTCRPSGYHTSWSYHA